MAYVVEVAFKHLGHLVDLLDGGLLYAFEP